MTNQLVKGFLLVFFVVAYFGSLFSIIDGFKENSWWIKNYRKGKAIDATIWLTFAVLIYQYT